MKTTRWYKYFKEHPEEQVGRYVDGVFEEKVLVVMPRAYWAYLDWMETELKGDITGFFKGVESLRTPEHGHTGQAYQNTVYSNMIEREKKGLKRPDWLDPATQDEIKYYDDYMNENM